jgi:hypothetical protein
MLNTEWLGGVSGVIWGAVGGLITWLGTEITRRLTLAREKREHIARALTELLEMRRYLTGFKIMKEHLEAAVGEPVPNITATLHAHLPQLNLIDWAGLAKRYNAAVTALAGIRPVLAYNLRSRDALGPFLQQFGQAALQNPEAALAWQGFDQLISNYGLHALTDAILTLARKHSWFTWRDAKKAIKNQDELPPELQTWLRDWLEQLKAQYAKHQAEQNMGATAAAAQS